MSGDVVVSFSCAKLFCVFEFAKVVVVVVVVVLIGVEDEMKDVIFFSFERISASLLSIIIDVDFVKQQWPIFFFFTCNFIKLHFKLNVHNLCDALLSQFLHQTVH